MLFVKPVLAQCPVCIVTVGGGMFLAKQLGIDDLLVSIWISALNTAISFWLAPKLKWRLLRNPIIFSVLMYAFTLFYFWYSKEMGQVGNSVLGIDKIFLGMTLGMLAMFAGNFLYSYFKKKNGDKALFPYSKVAFPVGSILILTLIFKFAFNL